MLRFRLHVLVRVHVMVGVGDRVCVWFGVLVGDRVWNSAGVWVWVRVRVRVGLGYA